MSTEAILGGTPAASSHVVEVWRDSCSVIGTSSAFFHLFRREREHRLEGSLDRARRHNHPKLWATPYGRDGGETDQAVRNVRFRPNKIADAPDKRGAGSQTSQRKR